MPHPAQGADIHALIGVCKPLDLNSTYAYLLLCRHFLDTCVVCMWRDELVGFLSAYLPLQAQDVVFVWQVAVHPDHRGRGLGAAMLAELLARPAVRDARVLETSVGPSNAASWAMFRKFAAERGAELSALPLFQRSHFGTESHEEEVLLRVSPLRKPTADANRGRRLHEPSDL